MLECDCGPFNQTVSRITNECSNCKSNEILDDFADATQNVIEWEQNIDINLRL